jgi:hypothetical protein
MKTGLINPLQTLRRGEATAPYHGFGRAGWLSPPSANIYETTSNYGVSLPTCSSASRMAPNASR